MIKHYVFMVRCNDRNRTLVVKHGKDPEAALLRFKKKLPEDIEYFKGLHTDGIVWQEEIVGRQKAMGVYKEMQDYTQQKRQRLTKVKFRFML